LSSILDALNKLEKEGSPQDYPLAHARAGRKGLTPKSVFGIIVITCVCAGAIGLAAYTGMRPEKAPEPLLGDVRPVLESMPQETQESEASVHAQKPPVTSLPETPVPLPSISPVPKTMATATASQPETQSLGHKTDTKPKSPEDKNNTVETKTQRLQRLESQEDAIQEAVVDSASQKAEPQVLPGEKDPPTSVNELSKEVPAKEEKPLPMDRIEGVGFKIQAISWGDTSPERLVVINNQVLREGDGIEGYLISRINPDDIILRRGSNTYRLDFGLKGEP
jgi:hypothetical protein